MSEHTKEWRVVEHPNGWTIQTADGECIAQQYGGSEITHPRRIVACVNELAGKPEGYVKQLESANAELVEALEDIERIAMSAPIDKLILNKAREAIAKHKGETK